MPNSVTLVLEPLHLDHAGEMFPGLSDPAGYRFLPDEPETLEGLKDRYARQLVGQSADGSEIWLNWVVRLCRDGDAVGFTQATIQAGSALLGYQLFPAHWHRGFGSMAVRLTMEMLFSRADVQVVRALVDTRNQASIALLTKLRFELRQIVVKADHFKGADSDEFEFIMTRAGWQMCRFDETQVSVP